MGLTRDWPYSDLHSMNLDWIIEKIQEYTQRTDEALATVEEKIAYIDAFFSNLDVQQEINNKLDEMTESGELARILKPISDAWLSEEMPPVITQWLQDNITPGTGAVDTSLSVAGAAADARAAGQGIGGAAAYANAHPITSWTRNIFNANTENKKAGAILNAEVNTIQAVEGYTAYVMPIAGGAVISTQGNGAWNAHIVVLDHYIDITKYSVGDTLTGVVDRWNDAGATSRTLPATAKCLVLSTNNPVQAMITYGAPASVFAEFAPHDYAIPSDPTQEAMHVGAGRMYPTINDAVAAAPDGATIIVHEGTYNEAVKAWGKTLYIYGVSRDNCVLQNGGGDYASPPLEMSSGVLANITIIAQGEPIAQGAQDKAYCLHMEGGSVPSAEGKSLTLRNVCMINQDTERQRPCAGIGLITDYTISFEDCIMHSYSGPCVYVHDYGVAGSAPGQEIQLIRCAMQSDSATDPVVLVQSQELADHEASLLAQANILYSSTGVTPVVKAQLYADMLTGDKWLRTSDWTLAAASAANTANILNALQYDDHTLLLNTSVNVQTNKLNIQRLSEQIDGHLLSDAAKIALLACFDGVAWSSTNGSQLINALSLALNPPVNLQRIVATYVQSGPVYNTDSLDSLRLSLTVMAFYDDGSSHEVYAYTLSGTLTEGPSVVTVAYANVTATFTVTVTDSALLYELPHPTTFSTAADIIDTNVVALPVDRDLTILIQFNPVQAQNRTFIFYTGQTVSPYNTIAIKIYQDSSATGHPAAVETHSSGINAFVLSNMQSGGENRVAIIYRQRSTECECYCYNMATIISGVSNNTGVITADSHIIIGGFATDDSNPYKGTITTFKAYSRVLTAEEIYKFIQEG